MNTRAPDANQTAEDWLLSAHENKRAFAENGVTHLVEMPGAPPGLLRTTYGYRPDKEGAPPLTTTAPGIPLRALLQQSTCLTPVASLGTLHHGNMLFTLDGSDAVAKPGEALFPPGSDPYYHPLRHHTGVGIVLKQAHGMPLKALVESRAQMLAYQVGSPLDWSERTHASLKTTHELNALGPAIWKDLFTQARELIEAGEIPDFMNGNNIYCCLNDKGHIQSLRLIDTNPPTESRTRKMSAANQHEMLHLIASYEQAQYGIGLVTKLSPRRDVYPIVKRLGEGYGKQCSLLEDEFHKLEENILQGAHEAGYPMHEAAMDALYNSKPVQSTLAPIALREPGSALKLWTAIVDQSRIVEAAHAARSGIV